MTPEEANEVYRHLGRLVTVLDKVQENLELLHRRVSLLEEKAK